MGHSVPPDRPALDHRTAGLALAAGYLLLFVALFRNPAEGLATAAASVPAFLFALVLPTLGAASGVYVSLDRPLRTVVAFSSGSVLAVVGLAVALLPTDGAALTVVFGIALFGLAVLALVGSLWSAVSGVVPSGRVGPEGP